MWVKILLIFFVFSFLFRTDSSFDQDLGRHLKLGEIIVNTHQVPKINLFSYTNPTFPFINTHWGFEAFVYIWSLNLGLSSLLILKILIFLLSVVLILKIIPKENEQVPSSGSSALLLPIGFILLHVLRERLELRPEIFSFLFTASTYFILEKYLKKPTKLIYLLPFIELLWINTHVYFFVGFVLQAIFIITHRKVKLLWFIFALSVLLSLINPNGLSGLFYPLIVNQNYGYTIVENQTIFLLESIKFSDPNFLFVKLSLGLIALSVFVSFLRRKFEVNKFAASPLKNILLSLFGGFLALLNVRSFPYLVFLSLPATLGNFGPIRKNNLTKLLSLIFGLLLILESYFYLNGDYYKYHDDVKQVGLSFEESGKGAVEFVLANNLPQPIFNNFDIGSYIIYKGYPEYKVFVDGRPEAYPKEFFLNTYIPDQSDYLKFKDLEKQVGFKTVIFSHTDQTPWGVNFLSNIVKDPDWVTVYIDNFMIVLIKKEIAIERNLEVLNLNKLDPTLYKFKTHADYLRLSYFLLKTGNTQSGSKFLEQTLNLFPKSPVANSIYTGSSSNPFFW